MSMKIESGIEMSRRFRRAIRKHGGRLLAQGLYSVVALTLVGHPVLAKNNLQVTATEESFEQQVDSLVPRFSSTTFCASATPVASGSPAANWEIGLVNTKGRCTVAQLDQPYFVTTLPGARLEVLLRQALSFRSGGDDAVMNRFGNLIAVDVLAELRSSVTSPDTGACGPAANGDPGSNGCTNYPAPEITCTMCTGDQQGGDSDGGVDSGSPGGGVGSFSSSEQSGGFGFRSLPNANLTGGGVPYSSLLLTVIPKNRADNGPRIGTTSFQVTSDFFAQGVNPYHVRTLPSSYQIGDSVPQDLGKACLPGGKQTSCSSLAGIQNTTSANFIVTPSNSMAVAVLPAAIPFLLTPPGLVIVGGAAVLLLLLPGLFGGDEQLGTAIAGLCGGVSSCVVERVQNAFFALSVAVTGLIQQINWDEVVNDDGWRMEDIVRRDSLRRWSPTYGDECARCIALQCTRVENWQGCINLSGPGAARVWRNCVQFCGLQPPFRIPGYSPF